MKKLLLLITFAFFLLPFSFAQQYGWTDISANLPGTLSLTDIFFISDDEGWITTSTLAEIYHTTDGGLTFEVQTTPLGATQAVQMLDANNGYSGGAGGWVYKTDDGGQNWNILATMGTLIDISFPPGTNPDNPVGYACGDNGQVWEITSTLTNLNSPSASTFRGISAPSVNHVWVCGGGSIFYYNGSTFDGQSGPGGTFNDIHFINNQEGWVVGDGGVIGHTTDGGSSWITQTNPDTQGRSLYGVFFLDSNTGWAVGFNGIILHTTDAGTTWVIEGTGLTTTFLRGVQFTSPTNGYIAGNNKTLLKYTEISGIGDETEPLKFEIYPNPAVEEFRACLPAWLVRSSEFRVSGASLELFGVDGRKLLEKQIPKGSEEISVDVRSLHSGLYFVRLTVDNKTVTKKLLIE